MFSRFRTLVKEVVLSYGSTWVFVAFLDTSLFLLLPSWGRCCQATCTFYGWSSSQLLVTLLSSSKRKPWFYPGFYQAFFRCCLSSVTNSCDELKPKHVRSSNLCLSHIIHQRVHCLHWSNLFPFLKSANCDHSTETACFSQSCEWYSSQYEQSACYSTSCALRKNRVWYSNPVATSTALIWPKRGKSNPGSQQISKGAAVKVFQVWMWCPPGLLLKSSTVYAVLKQTFGLDKEGSSAWRSHASLPFMLSKWKIRSIP